MSVATVSPFQRSKRLFEDETIEGAGNNARHIGGSKRARFLGSPAVGRCAPFTASDHSSAVNALMSIFPEMDDKVSAFCFLFFVVVVNVVPCLFSAFLLWRICTPQNV